MIRDGLHCAVEDINVAPGPGGQLPGQRGDCLQPVFHESIHHAP